jgi:beta-barrel assembly-enhancing protease
VHTAVARLMQHARIFDLQAKFRPGVLISVLGILSLCCIPAAAQAEPDTSSSVQESNEVHGRKHVGGKADIDSIGKRKIGEKGLGNWYSIEHEIQIGREYSHMVEASSKLILDPVVTEYVNRIGQNLVRNSDAQVPFTIKVIDSDEINAFALPGGFLYVTSGLILTATDEAELAGVMAHEIAHVAAHHATRQMTRSNLINLASIPLIFVGGGIGLAIQEAALLAIPLGVTKFSRSFEAEADYLGLEYLYKAGYDPQAFISFFERVHAQEKENPGKLGKAFATHPQTSDRIKKSQDEIAKILPPRQFYIISTSDFELARARTTEIENRRVTAKDDHGKPTLRHSCSQDTHSKDEDDRPTLRRRSN